MTICLAQRKLSGWETVCGHLQEHGMPPHSLTVLANWLHVSPEKRCPQCWAVYQEFERENRLPKEGCL